ncbi:MAG: RNA-directed DNA polymerase [Deltaproteobacteria bacterium]|nr:RNA-directed DNA polymerase [Deltaproteobacteria bacterium]
MGVWEKLKGLFSRPPPPPSGPGGPATPSSASSLSSPSNLSGAGASGAPASDPYQASAILGLSYDEMRKRAMKIDPMRTAWIGRVDTIPPQSDERTALIDRGLILRGFLTKEQIGEIHRVGDLWLRFHEADRLATTVAQREAGELMKNLAEEKAKKKEEKKRLAAERRAARQQAIEKRRREDIIYLGAGVSSGLRDRRSNLERLNGAGLPVLSTPADVAAALDVSIGRLRWLCYHSDAAERLHYVRFTIPKRSGGQRAIAAPLPDLKRAQAWILESVLEKLEVEPEAHGFVAGRSTLTNATPHLKREVIINLDLADFFPSIGFRRVRGVFEAIGYSPAVATIFALLSTEAPRMEVDYDGQKLQVAVGERALPQGAPTSPALSNRVARKLDRRLRGMATKHGWTYTRYADDLTFSAPTGHQGEVPIMQARIRHIVGEEGFAVNLKKGRVQRRSGRQEVTGVVVNDRPGLPRTEVRKLRAILHQAKKTGLAAQNRQSHPRFEAWLRGKIAYLMMIDPARGKAMAAELDALVG